MICRDLNCDLVASSRYYPLLNFLAFSPFSALGIKLCFDKPPGEWRSQGLFLGQEIPDKTPVFFYREFL